MSFTPFSLLPVSHLCVSVSPAGTPESLLSPLRLLPLRALPTSPASMTPWHPWDGDKAYTYWPCSPQGAGAKLITQLSGTFHSFPVLILSSQQRNSFGVSCDFCSKSTYFIGVARLRFHGGLIRGPPPSLPSWPQTLFRTWWERFLAWLRHRRRWVPHTACRLPARPSEQS